MRGAKEHGFYTEETDGILLDRVKFFWNADYGHLSFTTDHNMVKNCDGYGSGDAVVYPGASPQTGEYRDEDFYPEERYNSTIKKCDLHGSAMGYSGSMGNSVRVTQNHFYGNANGLTTDTLSAPGHPGFPADGMKIDHNWFYANNLDVYVDDPPFEALVPQPVGTGFFWAGNNNGRFEDNWVFDNWRQGTMLIGVPDALAGEAEGAIDETIHCPTATGDMTTSISTSCDNHYSGNHMGQVPPDFEPHPGLTKFGNKTSLERRRLDRSQRRRLLVGREHRQHRQLLVRQHRLRRHRRPSPATRRRCRATARRASAARPTRARPRSCSPVTRSGRPRSSTAPAAAGGTRRRSPTRPPPAPS